VPWSHQKICSISAMKLLGILFINKCWPTTSHTITAKDVDGWCQMCWVWLAPWQGPFTSLCKLVVVCGHNEEQLSWVLTSTIVCLSSFPNFSWGWSDELSRQVVVEGERRSYHIWASLSPIHIKTLTPNRFVANSSQITFGHYPFSRCRSPDFSTFLRNLVLLCEL
jgi:hypothetical protein